MASLITNISDFSSILQPSPVKLAQLLQSNGDNNDNLSPDYIEPTQQVSKIFHPQKQPSATKEIQILPPIPQISESNNIYNNDRSSISTDFLNSSQNTYPVPKVSNILPETDPSSPITTECVNIATMKLSKIPLTPITSQGSENSSNAKSSTHLVTKFSKNDELQLMSEQLKALWSANKKMKNSIDVLSQGVQNTSKTITQVQDALLSHTDHIENLIKKLSADFDTKMETFMLAIDNVIDKKLSVLENKFDKKLERDIQHIVSRVNEREGDLKKIEDCFSSYTVCLDTKINDVVDKCNSLDLPSLNTWGDVTNKNCDMISNLNNELDNIKTHLSKLPTNDYVNHEIKRSHDITMDNANKLDDLEKSIHQINNKCNAIHKHHNDMKTTFANSNKSVHDLFHDFNLLKDELVNIKSCLSENVGQKFPPTYAAAAQKSNSNQPDMSVRKKVPPANKYNMKHYSNTDSVQNAYNYRNKDAPTYQLSSNTPENSQTDPPSNRKIPVNNTSQASKTSHNTAKNLLICWDSNRKHIDTRRLCSLVTTEFVATPML